MSVVPARSGRLAAYSHLFLSGAKSAHKDGSNQDRPLSRTDPATSEDAAEAPHGNTSTSDQADIPQADAIDSTGTATVAAPAVSIVWSEHLGFKSNEAVHSYAHHLAGMGRRVALLWLEHDGTSLRRYELPGTLPNSYDAQQVDTGEVFVGEDLPEPLESVDGMVDAVVGQLARISRRVDEVLVAWEPSQRVVLSELISSVGEIRILSRTGTDALKQTYRAVKEAAAMHHHGRIGVFVIAARDPADAQQSCDRIVNMGNTFLGRAIDILGWHVGQRRVRHQFVGRQRMNLLDDHDMRRQWIRQLCDVLCASLVGADRQPTLPADNTEPAPPTAVTPSPPVCTPLASGNEETSTTAATATTTADDYQAESPGSEHDWPTPLHDTSADSCPPPYNRDTTMGESRTASDADVPSCDTHADRTQYRQTSGGNGRHRSVRMIRVPWDESSTDARRVLDEILAHARQFWPGFSVVPMRWHGRNSASHMGLIADNAGRQRIITLAEDDPWSAAREALELASWLEGNPGLSVSTSSTGVRFGPGFDGVRLLTWHEHSVQPAITSAIGRLGCHVAVQQICTVSWQQQQFVLVFPADM